MCLIDVSHFESTPDFRFMFTQPEIQFLTTCGVDPENFAKNPCKCEVCLKATYCGSSKDREVLVHSLLHTGSEFIVRGIMTTSLGHQFFAIHLEKFAASAKY